MAIFRKDSVPERGGVSGYPPPYDLGRNVPRFRHLTEAGGLTQFGVALETLHPRARSSQMHWEQHEDEFLYLLDGALTVVEDSLETVIGPGDSCCRKAGDQVAHCLRNHTGAPARYLIAGTRDPKNITHYPALDMLDTPNGYTHFNGTPYPKKGDIA